MQYFRSITLLQSKLPYLAMFFRPTGQSYIFLLVKTLLVQSDKLQDESLEQVANLRVWKNLFLPMLGVRVTSHFMQSVIMDSFASFLIVILSKFCQLDSVSVDSLCHAIFSDLKSLSRKSQHVFLDQKGIIME
jgi:hypothetical protein